MGNLGEMDKFLETYTLPKRKEEEEENLNRPIASKEIKLVTKNLPKEEDCRARWLSRGVPANISGRVNTYSLEAVPKIEMEGKLPNPFYEASVTLIPKPERDPTKKEKYRPISLMHMDAKLLNKI